MLDKRRGLLMVLVQSLFNRFRPIVAALSELPAAIIADAFLFGGFEIDVVDLSALRASSPSRQSCHQNIVIYIYAHNDDLTVLLFGKRLQLSGLIEGSRIAVQYIAASAILLRGALPHYIGQNFVAYQFSRSLSFTNLTA